VAITAVPVGKPDVALTPPAVQQATGLAALGGRTGDARGRGAPAARAGQEALQARDVEHQSELAGSQYGTQHGPGRRPPPDGVNTIAEEAFRRSAVVAAQAQVGLDARAHVLDLVDKHQADPQGFQAALEAGSKAYVAKLPPDLQGEAAKTYDFFGSRGFAQVHERWKSEQVDQQRATVMQAVDGKASDAANMARAGDYAGALAQIASLHDTYAAAGPLSAGGSGALSAVEIERHHEAASRQRQLQLRARADRSLRQQGGAAQGPGERARRRPDRRPGAFRSQARDAGSAHRRDAPGDGAGPGGRAAGGGVRDQGVAINRQFFMEGRAQDQLRERVDGVKIDEPVTRASS
jgi:hypothetical protein